MDLIGRIDEWARARPDAVAHRAGCRTLTYAELARRSDSLAAHLVETLPDDRSPVVVLGHKEPEMLVGFLGAAKAGHPYVPVDRSLPADRLERIVRTAGSRLTLTPDVIAAFPESAALPARYRVGPSDPFYVIFTSGSTGEPKGVVITLSCLTDFLGWMLDEQGFREEGEVFLNQAPFSFDLSVMDLYLSLASGGTLFSITADEVANPRDLYQALRQSAVTTWVSTPSFAQMCLVDKGFGEDMLPQVRRFIFCGETLSPEVAAALLDRFGRAEVWNTYGPTEATVATTSVRVDRALLARYSPLPIGRPKPGTQVRLLDESGQTPGLGERGEMVIVGPNVSPGYLGRPDLTARAFFTLDGQRAYRTGDWGRLRDGLLFFEGRRDDQVKLHGYRIELGDVEANLRALRGVRDAVVLVVPDPQTRQPEYLAACLILAERPALGDYELTRLYRERLGEKLPAYMVPRRLVFVDAFPMTPNGKADRRRLAELLT